MKIGNRSYDVNNKTYIMGILNVTPDSFSDGGRYNSVDKALKRCEKMIEEGADIIDIGGESTRPGYKDIAPREEMERLLPVIKAVKKRFDIPLSADTYKPETAKEAVYAGADLINDIWGFKYDEKMAELCGKLDIPCCLMHNRKSTLYGDFLNDVMTELKISIDIAYAAGVKADKIIIDPGIGFGKTYEQNLTVIRQLESFKALGFPLLLGASRKSVIGLTLDLPPEERTEGTVALSVIGVMKGVSFLRVHDVKENKRAVLMAEAVLKGGYN